MSPQPAPPPFNLNYAAPPAGSDLRTIAARQKAIMYCILGYLIFAVSQFFLPPPLDLIVALLALAVSVAGAFFVFMLALALYNTATGIVLGILTLVPLVGLAVLLVIDAKATNRLRDHGIQVGLMGARSDQIPAPSETPLT